MDMVFATDVLEHVIDANPCIKEVYRILKPRGLFVLTTPNREELKYVLCPDCHAIFHPDQHLRNFNELSISKLLIDNGFKIVKCTTVSRIGSGRPGKFFLLLSKIVDVFFKGIYSGSALFVVAQR